MWKLKCCLNYELDTYLDALKIFRYGNQIAYRKRNLPKQDIFKGLCGFAYTDNFAHWHV
jgi:cell fate regulator YaaT (PSP1 superfamily)